MLVTIVPRLEGEVEVVVLVLTMKITGSMVPEVTTAGVQCSPIDSRRLDLMVIHCEHRP